MMIFNDSEIVRSWEINAAPWIKAIQNKEIESRNLITNQAIIDIILAAQPRRVLDIGCGEGWLSKELVARDIVVFGIDAIPSLVHNAKQMVNAQFDICKYEDLSDYKFKDQFDLLVCNFSLIGKESTESVIEAAENLLNRGSKLIIQTLHPVIASGDLPYESGWRPGSWVGFSPDFKAPAPWYFRTIEDWCGLFNEYGFLVANIYEPIHPKTRKPASIIFDCVPK